MYFTGTVYKNPYWPTWPLLEITQGCTHNRCKFCTMYKDVPFRMSPMQTSNWPCTLGSLPRLQGRILFHPVRALFRSPSLDGDYNIIVRSKKVNIINRK